MNDHNEPVAAPQSTRFKAARLLLQALGVALFASALAIPILDIDSHEWRVPVHDSGDALLHQMMIRTVLDHGSVLRNPQLNAPFGMDLRDFPAWDFLTLGLARLIGIFTSDAGLVTNLTFLITFPLLAASTFLSLRWLGINAPFSLTGSLLYTFMPYHMIKGVGHLFLSNYVLLPPALALAVLVARGDAPRRSMWIVALLCGPLLGLNGVYYPAFAMIMLATASALALLRSGRIRNALPAVAMTTIILATTILGLLPVFQRTAEAGEIDAGRRHHAESEMYALKPASLVVPVQGHRIAKLDQLRNRYAGSPLYFENDTVAIGSLGTIALVIVLLHVTMRVIGRRGTSPMLDALALLTASAIGWASIGGGSSLFALLLTPQIRTWSRMVTVIAFLTTIALMYAVQRALSARIQGLTIHLVGAGLLLIAGLADQTTPRFEVHGPRVYPDANRAWIREATGSLPRGSAVFQFPPFPYPENGPIESAHDYDYFLPYLHSEGLRWSYGATRGRPELSWQLSTASLDPEALIGRLAAAGFRAVLVDRAALPPDSSVESTLASGLHPPAVSPDTRWALYRIAPRSFLNESSRQSIAFGEPVVTIDEGVSHEEEGAGETYRWASRRGQLSIHNIGDHPREVVVTFRAAAGVPGDWELLLSAGRGEGLLRIDEKADELYRARLTVPSGRTSLSFRTDAPRVEAPGDPRVLVFRIYDVTIRSSDATIAANSG